MASSSFFEPVGDGCYRATEHTIGPWDRDFQHGGPPSALLARAIEAGDFQADTVTRICIDLLGPVPVGEVEVRRRVLRPGRKVELVEAELHAQGRTAMRAQGWRIRNTDLRLPSQPGSDEDAGSVVPPFPSTELDVEDWVGCGAAMEWRVAAGDFDKVGPATVWCRMRYPLIADEEATGLQRVLVAADNGSGVSNLLPVDGWLFVNTDLTIHLAAVPMGEWICMEAESWIDRHGFGLASSRLFDRDQFVGRSAQTLYVSPR
jgi:hypothetical protein